MSKPALVVIDVQNDYFPGGVFPLWNTDAALSATEKAIRKAKAKNIPVILIQNVAEPGQGPFFIRGTEGVKIHPAVLDAAPDATVVHKQWADAFEKTTLDEVLKAKGVDELILCGMMTQMCVTHTAVSRSANDYRKVTVLTDAVTSMNEIVHGQALFGLMPRATLATVDEALA